MDNNYSRQLLWSIHQTLLNFYGPLHWWPGDTELEIMIGAILTQNTNWNNVSKSIEIMKEEGLLNISALLQIDQQLLGKIIKPCGYYNLKAKRLKNFINFFQEKYEGSSMKMFSGDWKVLREELLTVNGIGPETADSILLYAGKKPIFVVDAYTRRIFSRHDFFVLDENYVKIQKFFMANLPGEHSLYNEYHAQLVMVGKDFCKKKHPDCKQCPLLPFLK
jgi:endonuclease-3 related protein